MLFLPLSFSSCCHCSPLPSPALPSHSVYSAAKYLQQAAINHTPRAALVTVTGGPFQLKNKYFTPSSPDLGGTPQGLTYFITTPHRIYRILPYLVHLVVLLTSTRGCPSAMC